MKKYFYDTFERAQDLENFNFRNLHPKILLGTASDLYAGRIGQIYTADRYKGRISRRTYYSPLLGNDGKSTQNHHVLQRYRQHIKDGDPVLLKVPR